MRRGAINYQLLLLFGKQPEDCNLGTISQLNADYTTTLQSDGTTLVTFETYSCRSYAILAKPVVFTHTEHALCTVRSDACLNRLDFEWR